MRTTRHLVIGLACLAAGLSGPATAQGVFAPRGIDDEVRRIDRKSVV